MQCVLWIPPVAFCYPEIKVSDFKAEKLTSAAVISEYKTKMGECNETHCIYLANIVPIRSKYTFIHTHTHNFVDSFRQFCGSKSEQLLTTWKKKERKKVSL